MFEQLVIDIVFGIYTAEAVLHTISEQLETNIQPKEGSSRYYKVYNSMKKTKQRWCVLLSKGALWNVL